MRGSGSPLTLQIVEGMVEGKRQTEEFENGIVVVVVVFVVYFFFFVISTAIIAVHFIIIKDI